MQALSVELNKELKLNEAQKPISKPKSKPRCKSAITRSQKCKYKSEKIANTTKRERIEFYSTLDAWGMRINMCVRMRFVFEGIWIKGNLISKLSRKSNMKSQDTDSRRKRPDGWTKRIHAPKHVARSHKSAAEPRQTAAIQLIQSPKFRGQVHPGLLSLLHL